MSKLPPTTPLERYLDGMLSPENKERVERALAHDEKARKQVDLQRDIDASLDRLFAAGADTIPLRRAAPSRRLWLLAAAAVLLLALAGAWAIFFRAHAGGPSPLASIYHQQVDSGFIPKEVCTTREEFAKWVQTYYQQPLYPSEKHEGVEFVGWSNAPAIGKNSGVLLAKVQGKPVNVIVDRKVLDKKPFTSTGEPALKSFRQEFGPIVLYEVTPHNQPLILPLLSTSP